MPKAHIDGEGVTVGKPASGVDFPVHHAAPLKK